MLFYLRSLKALLKPLSQLILKHSTPNSSKDRGNNSPCLKASRARFIYKGQRPKVAIKGSCGLTNHIRESLASFLHYDAR
jgi:hypothetical protein